MIWVISHYLYPCWLIASYTLRKHTSLKSILTRKVFSWWHHWMETFATLLALCDGNPPVTGGFPSQRPVMRSFHNFFHLCLNKRLSKQSIHPWFEMPSRSLWRHCNVLRKCMSVWHLQTDGHFAVASVCYSNPHMTCSICNSYTLQMEGKYKHLRQNCTDEIVKIKNVKENEYH